MVGFITLFTDYVNVTSSKRKKIWPEKIKTPMDKQNFPSIRLHYIGVDSRFRKKGYGELLMIMAFDICSEVAQYVGYNYIVVEAMEPAVEFFEKYNFLSVKKDNNLTIMAIKQEDIDIFLNEPDDQE